MGIDEDRAKIVDLSADLLEQAADVIEEMHKRDGKEYGSEPPSMIETVAVANLLLNMKVAGMFDPPREDHFKKMFDAMPGLIESRVKLELSKAGIHITSGSIRVAPPVVQPPPPRVPPPPPDFNST